MFGLAVLAGLLLVGVGLAGRSVAAKQHNVAMYKTMGITAAVGFFGLAGLSAWMVVAMIRHAH